MKNIKTQRALWNISSKRSETKYSITKNRDQFIATYDSLLKKGLTERVLNTVMTFLTSPDPNALTKKIQWNFKIIEILKCFSYCLILINISFNKNTKNKHFLIEKQQKYSTIKKDYGQISAA